MTSEEFKRDLHTLKLSYRAAAKRYGKHHVTIYRYARGELEIPTLVELAIAADLAHLKRVEHARVAAAGKVARILARKSAQSV